MPHNRSMLMAAVAVLTLPMLSAAPVSAAPAAAPAMINGKPCVPVPGGSAKLGIQLYSLPGLLQGTATSIDEANNAAVAAAAARAAQAAARAGAPGAGAPGGGRGGAPGAGGPGGGGAPGGGRGGAAGGAQAAGAGGAAGAGRAAAATPPAPTLPDGSKANMALVDSTFARLKQLGYGSVERAGYYDMSPAQFKAALAKAGLVGVGGHDTISANAMDTTIDYLVQAGQKTYVGASGWQYGNSTSIEGVRAAAEGLNAAGQKALAKGFHLYVHNHTGEFAQVSYDLNKDGVAEQVPAIEALLDLTDPRYLSLEIDIHWIIEAYMGAPYNQPAAQAEQSALAFVRKHADRITLYHVKETTPGVQGGEGKMGQGITNWPAWWAAGTKVDYYIYEMDGPPNALEYATIAANYLQCKS